MDLLSFASIVVLALAPHVLLAGEQRSCPGGAVLVLAGLGVVASMLILLGTFTVLIVPARDAMIYQIINPPIGPL